MSIPLSSPVDASGGSRGKRRGPLAERKSLGDCGVALELYSSAALEYEGGGAARDSDGRYWGIGYLEVELFPRS